MTPPRLLFVARAAAGHLESQALMLCRSIRRFAGVHRDARIVVLAPPDEPLADATLRGLAAAEVEVHQLAFATEFPGFPHARKPASAAWAEARADEDVVVFVDSDSFFAAEPTALELPGAVAGVRPVNAKNVGTTGPGDPHEEFWSRVHERFGTTPPPLVETTVTAERIHGYWNTGLVAVRRDAGLMARWNEVLVALLREGFVPPDGALNYLDQVALAVALSGTRTEVLDPRHNYPLTRRARLPATLARARLDELVHVHYFRSLHRPGFLDELEPRLAPDCPVAAWLRDEVPLAPVGYGSEPRVVYRDTGAPR